MSDRAPTEPSGVARQVWAWCFVRVQNMHTDRKPPFLSTGDAPRDLPAEHHIDSLLHPPEWLTSFRKTLAAANELHAQGIGCPDCPPDSEDTGADCPMLVAAEAALARAERR